MTDGDDSDKVFKLKDGEVFNAIQFAKTLEDMDNEKLAKYIKIIKKQMKEHAQNLEFEKALACREQIKIIEKLML